MSMKTALIFLNGFYDKRYLSFYQQEIDDAVRMSYPTICADGGIRIFDQLNYGKREPVVPDVMIGDMDSIDDTRTKAKLVVEEWVGKTDKDWTDGQLAVKYALDNYDSRHIILYGGLSHPGGYEVDHFLANLKLMRFGAYLLNERKSDYKAEMRDPRQTIHYVLSELKLTRKNLCLQRVSLLAEQEDVVVKCSKNLRWDLTSLHINPDIPDALRNEFVEGAEYAEIQLTKDSAPVYVIHNWYD